MKCFNSDTILKTIGKIVQMRAGTGTCLEWLTVENKKFKSKLLHISNVAN